MKSSILRLRGLFDSTSHFGAALSVLQKVTAKARVGRGAVRRLEEWMGPYADYRTRACARRFGSGPYVRAHLADAGRDRDASRASCRGVHRRAPSQGGDRLPEATRRDVARPRRVAAPRDPEGVAVLACVRLARGRVVSVTCGRRGARRAPDFR